MTEPAFTRMREGGDFVTRLDDIERRLETAAARPEPPGLTEPDPDTPDEHWTAKHVWAHLAEIVGYWRDQVELVIGAYDGTPVPFGRTKRDLGRRTAIEVGLDQPTEQLIAQTRRSIESARDYLGSLSEPEWNAVGVHETLGRMDVDAIVERFIVSHLEEHLGQLDGLRAGTD